MNSLSEANHATLSRYSAAATEPFLILEARGTTVRVTTADQDSTFSGDPLEWLQKLLREFRPAEFRSAEIGPESQYFGPGAFGYLSYELGYRLQGIPCKPKDDLRLPDLWFAFYEETQLLDQETGKQFRLGKRIRRTVPAERFFSDGRQPYFPFPPEDYERSFRIAQEQIAAGNIYQVNLSRRFSFPFRENPWEAYQEMRKVHPTSLSAFLNLGNISILSFSPELFLRKEGNRIETRPIKGTVRKSASPEENRRIREELFSSPKNLAEHIMIVDLERNDLGKICEIGSIHPERFASMEHCGKVFHLVSTVTGKLPDKTGVGEIVRALFPGGSVTGAPKRKAMEIIGELEPVVRGVYTGALGWIGFSGDLMFNLPIRTVLAQNGLAHLSVGGGIVADSTVSQEYQEILDKGELFLNLLQELVS